MADNKIRDENYYTIHGWMINRLGLKGIQLSLYAIIYGFSQDGENEYMGRLQYLCDFTGGTSKPTVIKALKDLTERGLLQKREEFINGVMFVRYREVLPSEGGKEILPGVKKFNGVGKEILPRGGKEILPPTLQNNNNIHKERDREIPPPSPEKVVEMFNVICTSLPVVQFLTDNRRDAIEKACEKYTMEQFQRCFEIAQTTPFLKGENDRRWKASFDWLMDEDNIAKILEGNYEDAEESTGSFNTDSFYEAAVRNSLGGDFTQETHIS